MESRVAAALSAGRERDSSRKSSDGRRNAGGPRRSTRNGSNRLQTPYEDRSYSKSRSNEELTTALKFLIPNVQSGTFIGLKGSAIKELMEVSGADIHISGISDLYPGTTDRVVYITGTDDAVSTAQSLIWEMFARYLKSQSEDVMTLCEWSPRQASDYPSQFDEEFVEGKITIPEDAAGSVIGRGGANIRSVMEESGCKITINNKESSQLTKERVVTLSGTVLECINATSLILSKLSEDIETAQYTTKGSKYPNSVMNGTPVVENRMTKKNLTDRTVVVGTSSRSGNNSRIVSSPRSAPMELVSDVLPLTSTTGLISATTTITIAVPNPLIGNILGKQGETLKEIIALSGAQVMISAKGEYIEGTNNRVVTITGSPAAAQTAHTLISNKIQ